MDCPAVRRLYPNGVHLVKRKHDPYRLDADHDGRGCEPSGS